MLTLFKRLSLPDLTRISLGIENSAAEIDTLLQVLRHIAAQPRVEADRNCQPPMDKFVRAAAQKVYGQS